jgi:hypothetical protein
MEWLFSFGVFVGCALNFRDVGAEHLRTTQACQQVGNYVLPEVIVYSFTHLPRAEYYSVLVGEGSSQGIFLVARIS